jgi:hypothetical protein
VVDGVLLYRSIRGESPLLVALVVVGTALGGLLVGYEPVGGDPDRLYRPIKIELARSLAENQLPFWSTRFGMGAPLVAESHVAAFYPPNLIFYRFLDVRIAYQLSMWLHYVALVVATYLYARCLQLSTWGSALAGVTFALCGFLSIHSSHEPFYCVMPYLALALSLTELYMTTGQTIWLALLAGCLGLQLTLGHFQIQMWTGVLVLVSALWRAGLNTKSWPRALAVIAAIGWGGALAAVQLGPSWQLADKVHQTDRTPSALTYYSYPPAHWFELALPRLIQELRLGPEDPYWHGQQTWGYEAALYVGSIPLVFAFIGALGRPTSRSCTLWRILVPLGFALATMPRWWPQGYLHLIALPGIGYFRSPARYTLFTSLGLALLAGEGFDRSIARMRFRLGLAAALGFAVLASVAADFWTNRPDVRLVPWRDAMTGGFVWGAVSWLIAVTAVLAWRTRRLPSWVIVIIAGLELGILFYNGATLWGWAVPLPAQSPVMTEILARSPMGLVGGEIENLPVRVGLPTAYPYLGFGHPNPNRSLMLSQMSLLYANTSKVSEEFKAVVIKLWFRRCRVQYLVTSHQSFLGLGRELGRWQDPALEQMVRREVTDARRRVWSLIELGDPIPEVRVALRAETIADRTKLISRLCFRDELELAMFLAEHGVPSRANARSGRVKSWDGFSATIEHDGTCDLVLARAFDPGWLARIDDGPEQPVLPVDDGFQAVRVEGSGTHRISLRYQPRHFVLYALISLTALALLAVTILASMIRLPTSRLQNPRPNANRGTSLS